MRPAEATVAPDRRAATGRGSGLGRVAAWLDREMFVAVVVVAYALVLLTILETSFGSDSWLMLVGGRYTVEHGIPDRDLLTAWTAGRHWIDQQWLAQLAGYGLFRALGLGGLGVANVAAALSALALALAGARRRGASARSASLVAIACVPALLPFSAVRPQTLVYPFFVALFLLLESSVRPTRRTLLCLPVLALWANLHGSALLGAGLVSLWAGVSVGQASWSRRRLDADWPRYLALAAGAWGCLLATPYGLSVVGYYRRILFNSAFGDLVTEWMRPGLPQQLPFFLLAAIAVVLVLTPRPGYSWFARAALAATAAAGLTAVRHTAWLPLLVVVLAPRALDTVWRPRAVERHARLNVAIVSAALVAVVAFGVVGARTPDSRLESPLRGAAARAAAAATERTGGPVFADSELADWLLWRRPELAGRVAFDIRFELLTQDELRQLGAFFNRSGPAWRQAASCCPVLVLGSKDRVTRALRRDAGIRVAYADDTVTVLVRPG